MRRNIQLLAALLLFPLAASAAYTVSPPKKGGSVRASVRLAPGSPLPVPKMLEVTVDRDACGNEIADDSLIVDSTTRAVANVVVRLEGIARGKAPGKEVRITNRRCRFEPHMSVATVGQTVIFLNDDPILHSMHPYLNKKNFFNVPLQPNSRTPRGRPLPETGLMELGCDIHAFMKGLVFIHDSPYAGVTGADGSVVLSQVPPGSWAFVATHEVLGEQRGTVVVRPGEAATLTVEMAGSRP